MEDQFLEQSLDALIRDHGIYTLLQPIVDIKTSKAFGHEALSRGVPGQVLLRPDQFFKVAFEYNRLTELELLCMRTAVMRFLALNLSGDLFLNISPITLLDLSNRLDQLVHDLEKSGLDASRVVIEISERYHTTDIPTLLNITTKLKRYGFRLAIDDLGTGHSGLKFWSQLQPDFIKIDRHFVDRIDQDYVKQAFVRSMTEISHDLNCQIIAEGVEQEEEARKLEDMGIKRFQGYLFGRPDSIPKVRFRPGRRRLNIREPLSEPIANLARQVEVLSPNSGLTEAETLFREDPHCLSIPVVLNEVPVGILHRQKLLEVFASTYGRSLYEKRDVKSLMQTNPMVVDCNTTIEAVSKLVTADDDYYLRQHFLVTRQGDYLGMANTKSLLRRITDSQIQRARYANPLTQLPGNVPIEEHLKHLIDLSDNFMLMYIDINHFKPFNDTCGYQQGDRLLRWTANLLRQECQDEVFVGHIGGG
ncbi:MAG: hypothetical protein CMI09_15055 [Oceanospirillaceae bacterium]|nr:hypothetical protein [Oceanospirillaceae bacterium]